MYRTIKIPAMIWMSLALLGGTAALLAQTQQPAQAAQKTWKSQAEFDAYSAAVKETDAKKKLALVDAWKEQFPATDFQQQRLALYVETYRLMNDFPKVLATLNDLLALDPKDLQVMNAIMIFTLPPYNQSSPAAMDNAVKAANAALAGLDNRPAAIPEADWPKTRSGLETLSHTVLGWVAMNRSDNPAAEQEFLKVLKSNPDSSQVDVWLGNVQRAQKTPEKTAQALFFYARAAVYEGPGALPPDLRRQFDDFLRKAYNGYHGQDDAGLSELKKLAKAQPLPPEGFTVKAEAEIAAEKAADFEKANPQLALWMNLKKELTSPNAAQYFDANMKGADVPGGAGGVSAFKATILSARPALRPKELVVAIADAKTPEVTLRLDTALAAKPETGSEIEFDGVPDSFTADPFMVTFQVERANIKGLKLQAAPVTAKKALPKKK
ncbi:MAG TPA: hypothetical protein VGH38_32020 [Bryobacteraceae bacterium]